MTGIPIEKFEALKSKIKKDSAEREVLLGQNVKLREELECLKIRNEAVQKAREILKQVALDTQKNLEFHISKLVTMGMKGVNTEWPRFVAQMVTRRGKTECDLLFEENDKLYEPEDGSGFGPIDVASFTSQLSYWVLDKNRPFFAWDEPFRHVDPLQQGAVSEMVTKISRDLKMQFLIISHAEDIHLSGDKTFLVRKVGGISKVEELK